MLWEPSQTIHIHLTHKSGTYTLVSFDANEFTYKTKRSEPVTLPFYYFRCLHGDTLVNTPIVQVFLEHMEEKKKSPQMWAQYQNHLAFMALDQMTERELNMYFSKPYSTV